MKHRIKIAIAVLVLFGLVQVLRSKPTKLKCEYPGYFAELNAAIKNGHAGASAGIIDLDRLDHNVDFARQQLGSKYKLRLVAKSLPSLDLLKYLMEKGQTNKLMVFSEPFISEILKTWNADSLDILLGKPLPVDAVARLSALKGWNSINWLVDTKERLNEYLAFAKKGNTPIKISLEIDIGLHRGGFETTAQFAEALEIIKANAQYLQLTGLMGYDGHVPYVPFYINKEHAISNAFEDAQQSYSKFVDELKKHSDPAFVNTLTFNSGGSRTYFRYRDFKGTTPVNDVAMGSGFLCPAQFPELEQLGHQPVLFLSSPVLKKIASSELPFAEKISPIVNWWNPNLKVSYYMLGGGWPGNEVAPTGLVRNPFLSENDLGYSNLLPNQSLSCSSDESNMQVGDFIFSQAWEGDGMLVFEKVLLYRKNKIVGEWETYKGGN